MGSKVYESFMFSELELGILLNKLNVTELYGLFNNNTYSVDRQAVVLETHKMIKEGKIICEKDKFIISNEIRSLLECVINSEVYLSIMVNREQKKEYLCYLSENNIVISEISKIRNNSFKFTKINYEVFYEDFINEIIPKEVIENSKDIEDVKFMIDENYKDYLENGLLPEEIVFLIERIDNKGKEILFIYEELFDYFICNIGEKKFSNAFRKDLFLEKIKEMCLLYFGKEKPC